MELLVVCLFGQPGLGTQMWSRSSASIPGAGVLQRPSCPVLIVLQYASACVAMIGTLDSVCGPIGQRAS
jgi:hypothetical protein